MEPIETMQAAIKSEHLTKGVAMRLGLHVNTVYKELSDSLHCTYTRFLQRFFAIDAESPSAADAIFEDFRARVIAVRRQRSNGRNWIDAVANVVKESSEAIQAALTEGDQARVEKEIVQAIEALRDLLELGVEGQGPKTHLSVARAGKSEAGHR